MGAFKALLVSNQPLRELPNDPSLPHLLLAMQQTTALLLRYRCPPPPFGHRHQTAKLKSSCLQVDGQCSCSLMGEQ